MKLRAATKVEMSGSEKTKWTRTQTFPTKKSVTMKLKEVSRFSSAKQRQGNVQKVCCTCRVGFLLFSKKCATRPN